MTGLVLIMLATFASLTAARADKAEAQPPRALEARAIWIDAGAIPKTAEGIRNLVRDCRRANLNLLLPEVVARGYTVYPSRLIERDPRFAGAIDPLPVMVEEAHRLGMEVHPWVWVFRAGYSKDRGSILRAHPDWAELDRNGNDLSRSGGLWISPIVPQARDLVAAVFAELVSTYDVDGLHLDYIRYENESNTPYGYSTASRGAFERMWGVDPTDIERLSVDHLLWNKFRERQINTFVQRIALQTRFLRPTAMISAAVAPDPTSGRLNLMQNWVNWVDNGWLDFVVPMVYSTNDDYFRRIVGREIESVAGKAPVVVGVGFFQHKSTSQTVAQIEIARKLGAAGQSLFAASYLAEPLLSALRQGPYSRPASLPFRQCPRRPPPRYVRPTAPPLNIPQNVIPLPTVRIGRLEAAMTIDGRLDDEGWRTAARVELSYTNLGEEAPARTQALLAYDETALYIAFNCSEPTITATKTDSSQRDGPVFEDDSVEVFLDPRGAGGYVQLSTNTAGTQYDARQTNVAWNGEWRVAAALGAAAWTVELAVPFAALGAETPHAGATWRINLARNRYASGQPEHMTWAVPYGSFHTPDRFGLASFE